MMKFTVFRIYWFCLITRSQLMEDCCWHIQDVRQKVLLTHEAPEMRAFYEKHRFMSCDQGDVVAFTILK